ncbi:Membrane protein implicated in regulation of membrane protease activity [Sinosporangium album]|uniref:Membrane protein implicated in regulation of membrane protease activity n=1 Tax=Sinosporangium album TaxID=504805 RepID=A0A1G8CLI0_9ACTN|nr:NfeD family protein [Sinosporangium album]SDH46133.1 Membrane protein implicated in regulation of membrane protease activity [Sinosporangium album]
MEAWVVWLILAVALGVAEIFTLTTALALLGASALLTAGVAAVGLPLPLQLLVFAIASAAGIVLVRPVAARHMKQSNLPSQRFGVQALVGRSAYVTHEVTGRGGRIRIGGEEWTARAYDETLVIPEGATVDVIQIEGATALVYPREHA